MDQYKTNPKKWYRIKDIQEGLKLKGFGNGTIKNVGSHCYKLAVSNFISVKGVGVWKHYKKFRHIPKQ